MKRNFWSKSRHSVSLVAGLLTRLLIVRNTPLSTINTRRNIGEMVVRCNVQTKQILQAENCEKVCTEKGSRSLWVGLGRFLRGSFGFFDLCLTWTIIKNMRPTSDSDALEQSSLDSGGCQFETNNGIAISSAVWSEIKCRLFLKNIFSIKNNLETVPTIRVKCVHHFTLNRCNSRVPKVQTQNKIRGNWEGSTQMIIIRTFFIFHRYLSNVFF